MQCRELRLFYFAPKWPERRRPMYIEFLKKSLAEENEAVRLYAALVALAPKSHGE